MLSRAGGKQISSSQRAQGLPELYLVDRDAGILSFIIDDAERIWEQERDAGNLLGRNGKKSLLDQAGMFEIDARLAQLRRP